jgi:hypothetical protein
MSEIQFAKNFKDLSTARGVDAGFQFEFYCERCADTWRSEFVPYRSGQASGWVGKAASMFGGVLGSVGTAVDGLAQSGFGEARDAEFRSASEQAAAHFHRCGKCHSYVCARCFNAASGLCYNCAPSVEVAIEAARTQGEIQGASQKAADEGAARGAGREVARDRQLVCPACGVETHGAKFCPECGQRLGDPALCACGAKIPPGAKFCPECGAKAGG